MLLRIADHCSEVHIMFDPTKPDDILTWGDKDLTQLPASEDDGQEYKSSSTKDNELAEKIARAASGFWNSGGGLFVAGVDGQGQADGGLSPMVGRQSRRDWIDQAVNRVTPQGRYVVHCVTNNGSGLKITPGNLVVLIGFGESEVGPHMSPDHRYYIRAGAHTVPATHFIVEAIHARRGLRVPMLRSIVRQKPDTGGVLQLGLVSLNDVPALDVRIELDPLPHWIQQSWASKFPLQVSVISRQFPFFFDIHLLTLGTQDLPTFTVNLRYFDTYAGEHSMSFEVDVEKQLGPNLGGDRDLKDVTRAVEKVADAIRSKR
jgi:hypothetical protein